MTTEMGKKKGGGKKNSKCNLHKSTQRFIALFVIQFPEDKSLQHQLAIFKISFV